MMEHQALHRTATPETVATTWRGELSQAAYRRALELCAEPPVRADWLHFLDRLLLLAGVALVLSGVTFFFAYNWSGLSRFQKLGLLEAAVLALALAAWRTGLDRILGQVLLTAAALMVGPLLAVFGQAYQTGADSYTLFLTWALFVTPWVLAGRFGTLWLVFVALWNLALGLFWDQSISGSDGFYLTLAVFNGGMWAIWERLRSRGTEWMAGRQVPRALAVVTLGWLTIPAILTVWGEPDSVDEPLCLALLIGLWVFLLRQHRSPDRDLFVLAMALTSVVTVLTNLAGNVLLQMLDLDTFGVLALAILLLAQVGWSARWLRQIGGSPA
ncbi:MAG: DUF2157 domain-containing protein [Armatimonadetes bacterium]|nr:DUF2157 domain-containing protein [Armatimonadota bacterium]